jgi:homogentisate solanesyltransferase
MWKARVFIESRSNLFTSQAFQIETFATKVGVKRIAQGASFCLLANYIHAIATGLLAKPGVFRMVPMVGGHTALAAILIARFRQLDSDSPSSIKTFYKHVWDLFYLEYVLYTLI